MTEISPNAPLILIVDDDIELCTLLDRVLASEGFQVKTMYHGQPALEWLSKHTPDAIVLDIMMPDMDGFELLSKVRGIHVGGEMPVIMLSGRMNQQAIEDSQRLGADAWLSKTEGMRQLVTELKERLARH